MKSWPQMKLGQVEVCLDIIIRLAHRKSYLVIICPNSHEKSTKTKFKWSHYLP